MDCYLVDMHWLWFLHISGKVGNSKYICPINSPIGRWWYSEILTNQIFSLFFSIIKLLHKVLMGLSLICTSSFFFFGIPISKQIALASLFSFPLRIKTSFRKNITDDSVSSSARIASASTSKDLNCHPSFLPCALSQNLDKLQFLLKIMLICTLYIQKLSIHVIHRLWKSKQSADFKNVNKIVSYHIILLKIMLICTLYPCHP